MSSVEVWNSMGYAARVILVVLVAFAALLFFSVVDRFIAYRRAERPPPSTAPKPELPPVRSAAYAASPLSSESSPTPP